jgi:hypothetical protein
MPVKTPIRCTAFEGTRRIAVGELPEVALETKAVLDRGERAPILIFDDTTSEQIEIDFRGTTADVLRRLADRSDESTPATAHEPNRDEVPAVPRGPGRPRLGVVAREVTLLPRHWEWLGRQPGGASVALRKLVEDARRTSAPADRRRRAQEAAYRFLSAMAGNLPGFEEANRALFAGDAARFHEQTETWPADVRDHARRLAASAFAPS